MFFQTVKFLFLCLILNIFYSLVYHDILTPTTKAADHDVPVIPEEIIERGLMSLADYEEASAKALSLFEYGQQVTLEHGLVLVDTKYQFGKVNDGSIFC
ncbi:PREDICTED: phosphoribosylaminoimidazole-succinocarboxamide synthase, chloroplastic-like [Lupinus angustifolius]|uniref:phosphoribosylaminoimidazole-succinocarboxamide synthase, chloroplastic-like n=1 Tax=Lupinus angustifolius TaxID=3871 RepID=UPI00092EEF3A|nr:PREDICTED: phosphoribosylaminoimidazole-succinocarboxamide synthase, chloroplastic-like [Lupinus angustifolius]